MKPIVVALGTVLAVALGTPAAFGQAKDLNKCQAALAKEGGNYLRAVADTVGKCLKKMSTEVVEGGATTAAAATTVAGACVSSLRKIVNTDDATKQLADKFNAKVGKSCDPAINPKLLFAESDTYTIGATQLSAAKLNAYCTSFGGDGAIGSFNEWRDCVRRAGECAARQEIATQWPRALEYNEALNTAIMALPASSKTTDALSALHAIDNAIEGSTDDNVPELVCGPLTPAFKRVFVTSTGTNGNFGGLAGGDAFCQTKANAAGLGGTWTAWLSDSTTAARARITNAVYVRVDGSTLIGKSLADIVDCTNPSCLISAPLTEFGATYTQAVWTATLTNGGSRASNCLDWHSADNAAAGSTGQGGTANRNWTNPQSGLFVASPCNVELPLYCFEN